MKTLYFDDSPEPDEFYFELMKDIVRKYREKGKKVIGFEFEDKEDFYNSLYALNKIEHENIEISAISREGTYDIVLHDEVDLDDESAPSIEADAKKKKKSEKEEMRKKKEEEIRKELEEEEAEMRALMKKEKKASKKKS